jgi:hypothetical protein
MWQRNSAFDTLPIAEIVGLVDLHDVRALPAAISAGSHQP